METWRRIWGWTGPHEATMKALLGFLDEFDQPGERKYQVTLEDEPEGRLRAVVYDQPADAVAA
jgi:hypothetical protein